MHADKLLSSTHFEIIIISDKAKVKKKKVTRESGTHKKRKKKKQKKDKETKKTGRRHKEKEGENMWVIYIKQYLILFFFLEREREKNMKSNWFCVLLE